MADALASGASVLRDVGVQVPFAHQIDKGHGPVRAVTFLSLGVALCRWESLRAGQRERAVEHQPVALVVIDHCATLVRVVVRALDDAAALLDGLRRGVDVGGLDPDDDLAGDRMVDGRRPGTRVIEPPSMAA